MVIFLYGPDDFRREQKKKLIIEEFRKKHSNFGLDFFDLREEERIPGLKEFIRAQSIFEPLKLAVLEGVFPAPSGRGLARLADSPRFADEAGATAKRASHGESENVGELLDEFKSVLENKKTTLLFSESGEPSKKFGFLIEKPAVSQKFDYLVGPEWQSFIINESHKLGIDLDKSALASLSQIYQNNTWGLITELEKLSNLGSRHITKSDLERLSLEALPNYWAVLAGLRGYDISSRLSALDQLFSQNEPPPKIFNILASQWREKTPEMAEYDLMVKSGKLEYEEALVDLII